MANGINLEDEVRIEEDLGREIQKSNGIQDQCMGFYILARNALGQEVEYSDSEEIREYLNRSSWGLAPLAKAFEPFLEMSNIDFMNAIKARGGINYGLYNLGLKAMNEIPKDVVWSLEHVTPLHPNQNHRFSSLCLLALGNNYMVELLEKNKEVYKNYSREKNFDGLFELKADIDRKTNEHVVSLAKSDTSRLHRGLYSSISYFLKEGN